MEAWRATILEDDEVGESSIECEYCGKEGTIYDIASSAIPVGVVSPAEPDPNWICYPVGWFISGGVCACSLTCARAIDAEDAKHPEIEDNDLGDDDEEDA
jgi:hypothetical protein